MSVRKSVSRRTFLRNSTVGAAGLVVASSRVSGKSSSVLATAPAILTRRNPNDTIGLGIIGVGIRGKQLMRAAGFRHLHDPAPHVETKLQPALNLRFLGACDLYDLYRDWGVQAAGSGAKPYRHYQDLLENKDIDAVIIATSDHWHAPIAVDAAEAGKDIYLEKCMTRTIREAKRIRRAVKANKRIFQLGHQGRHSDIHKKAKEIIEQGMLGNITLVETYTNRNSPNGAWVYDIPAEAGPHNIDWKQWTGKGPKRSFDLKRFFRWRCYWDYGTGLGGDMLTHEMDAINQIMGIGIPSTAIASGGIYFYKDGREVPDLYQVVYEYPERNLTVKYSATLANSWRRGKLFMGNDATMDLTDGVNVFVDRNSPQYQEKIKKGEIKLIDPLVAYQTGKGEKMEAVTSPTERWTIAKGLLYTYTPEGGVVNATYLHLKEWIECMRMRHPASCNEDVGFEEAITAHMSTLSFKRGRKIRWDAARERAIVA